MEINSHLNGTNIPGFISINQVTEKINNDNYLSFISGWIETVIRSQNRVYYRDQTIASLELLVNLVKSHKPSLVIELGTLNGMSLRTWLLADPNLRVTAVDLSFEPLRSSLALMPVDLSRVKLIERDILQVDFAGLWSPGEKVILYVDAHDLPGVPIMAHVLDNAVPNLPVGSIVVVDDLWYSPESLNEVNARDFFNQTLLHQLDWLQCWEAYIAPYWKGGSFIGFPEVVPLLEWVNNRSTELSFQPGNKSVFFQVG